MPRSTPARLPALPALAILLLAPQHARAQAAAEDRPEATAAGWRRTPLGDHAWQGYTHTVVIAGYAVFLHGRTADVLEPDGSWQHFPEVLAHPVDYLSAVARYDGLRVAVVPGRGKEAYLFDPLRRVCETLPGFAVETGRGACLLADGQGGLLCMTGGGGRRFVHYRDGRLVELPDVQTVSSPGKYSAGLVRMGRKVLAFGDHHVSVFDLDTMEWAGPASAPRLFKVMGFRPALDRGGMVFQDEQTEAVYVTLGKDARTVGVLLPNTHFHYLNPRLPIALRDSDRTLFVGAGPEGPRLSVLSLEHGAIYWIPLTELTLVDIDKRAVETGSRWESWNSWRIGARGDLVRERDSTGNALFLDPFIFVHRKNSMRTIVYDKWNHSPWAGAPEFGKRFATKGAAICTDGRRIYVIDGASEDLYCLELFVRENGADSREMVPITEALVRRLAPCDPFPAGNPNDDRPRNATLVCHGGLVYALLDPVTRVLHVYDPQTNRWDMVGLIPSAIRYTDELGVDLMSAGDRILLLGGGELASHAPGEGWGEVMPLSFEYSADGGMAVYDPIERLVYVVLGGRSRDFAVVDPRDGSHRVLEDFLPDVVSVHGRRLFLTERDGHRYLNIQRGHDSSEFWRTPISGEFRLSAR